MAPESFSEEEVRLARSVLARSLGLKRGENLLIETWTHGLPLAETFVVEARRMGVHAMVVYEGERAFFESQRVASARDASTISAPELAAVAATDAYLYLPGPDDIRRWMDLPADRRTALDRAAEEWGGVVHRRGVRAAFLHYAGATPLAAREHEVDLDEWRRETREGTLVPPAEFRRAARKAATALARGRRVTVTHENGTHLDLGLAARPAVVQDGEVARRDLASGHNWAVLPAGFLIVAPDERVADGTFVANRLSRHRRGSFYGARWTFEGGRLTDHSFERGGELFESAYRTAGKERDRPALFQLGLNPKIRDAPLQEDQERGVVTMYIGRNDDFGGRTRGSFREYALLEGADVTVDERPIVRCGRLL